MMQARTRRSVARVVGGITTVVLFLSGCGALRDDKGRPLNTLSPKGPQAQRIDDLVRPVFIIAGIVFVFIHVAVVYIAIRYRARDEDPDPVQTHGNPRLEWGWTILPAMVLAILAVFNVQSIWQLEQRDSDAMKVTVVGQQWWWEFRYDTDDDGKPDIITAQQMVVPAGRQIDLQIRSNDVIHSFWIPMLNGKRDAVPGRTQPWSLEADKPGIYQGQCTEFCGLSHGYMRMEVKALSPADFDKWVENQLKGPVEPAADSLEAEGKALVVNRCLSCHQINGLDDKGESTGSDRPVEHYRGADHPLTAANAPNLTHLMSRNHFAGNMFDLYEPGSALKGVEPVGVPKIDNLQRWLQDPHAMKPMAADQNRGMPTLGLSAEEIRKVTSYLVTLK